MNELIRSPNEGEGVNWATFFGGKAVTGVALLATTSAGVADGLAWVATANSGAGVAGATGGVETAVGAALGAATTETSGAGVAITGAGVAVEAAKATAGAGVAFGAADSTEIPDAAGAAGTSAGWAEEPVACAFDAIPSAGIAFTTASLALAAGEGAGICAAATCVPSSVFTSEPGIGLGSIAGPDDSVWVEATAAALGAGEEIAAALFNQPKS